MEIREPRRTANFIYDVFDEIKKELIRKKIKFKNKKLKDIKITNNNIKILEEKYKEEFLKNNLEVDFNSYIGRNNKVKAKCLSCMYEWKPHFYYILKTKKCKRRSIEEKFDKKRIKEKDILDLIIKKGFVWISDYNFYKKNKSRVILKCKKDHFWETSFGHIKISGTGCPKCKAGKKLKKVEFEGKVLQDVE